MNKKTRRAVFLLEPLPENHGQALEWLMELVSASGQGKLPEVTSDNYKRGWYAIGFLYPGLHPDSAMEHGSKIVQKMKDELALPQMDPRLLAPYYQDSGWPLVLAPVVKEACRRYEAGELSDEQFYCSEAVIAGMCFRDPALAEQVRREREEVGTG